ncbi:hypothetical protein PG988_006466 [Apiospora saccharicola]
MLFEVPFEEYDSFFQKVLERVRKHVALCRMFRNSTDLELRLVVDLDSSLNSDMVAKVLCRKGRIGPRDENSANRQDQGKQEEEMFHGYSRYFARPATPDWLEDVSGYRLTDKGLDIEGGGEFEVGESSRFPDQMMAPMHL